MQNVSPEQMAGLLQGATPVQIVIMIMLGVLACAGIILIVLNLIKLHVVPIKKELEEAKDDRKILREIQTQVTLISKSLWTKDDIQEKIHSAINEHVIEHHAKTINPQ